MESRLVYHQGCVKVHIAHKYKLLYFNTKVKVPKKELDAKYFVKATNLNAQNLNQQIRLHKHKVDTAITKDLNTNGEVDLDRVRQILYAAKEEPVVEVENKKEAKLSNALRQFIKTQANMNRGLKWRYDYLLDIIVKNDGAIQDVNAPYIYSLIKTFCAGINANTAGTRYKNFKKFYLSSLENGYPLPKFEWKKHKPRTFKPDFVYLDETKILQLLHHRPSTTLLQHVKEIFLVLVYTGMRYSDYESLAPDELIKIGESYAIEKVAKKTKVRFKVDVHPNILTILQNPPKMAGQVFNRELKELGKELGWDEMIRVQIDTSEFEIKPFHQLLKSSVGRHTAATRWLLADIPHNVICAYAGWSDSHMIFYYSEKLGLATVEYMNRIK